MPKEKIKKGDATRAAVEDAAISLFMEHGYHATSMRQIAERAGLALGGIYNHFESKDDIFEAIIIDKHPYKRIVPLIMEVEGKTTEEFVNNAARIIIKELTSQPYYIRLMIVEISEFNGRHGAALIKEIAPKILPIFEKLIRSRKELRVKHPAVLMRSFIGLILSYLLTEIIVSQSVLKNIMPKNILDSYVDIYMHGVIKGSA